MFGVGVKAVFVPPCKMADVRFSGKGIASSLVAVLGLRSFHSSFYWSKLCPVSYLRFSP
jgi:hypothetical protein